MPSGFDEREDGLEARAFGVEAAVLAIAAKRMATLPDATLAEAMAGVPSDLREMDAVLAKGSRSLSEAASRAVMEAEAENEEWAAPFYAAAAATATGRASEIVREGAADARKAVEAVCRTKAVGLAKARGTGFVPMREAYGAAVSRAASKMAQGSATGEKAVAEAVGELCRGGLRVVSYDGGAQRVRELHSAVRMNVRDAYSRAMGEARAVMGREFGADGVEVTAHGMCAPDHLPYQGRQYTDAQFARIQSRLERPIGEGMNCRHMAYPVILGASEPAYSAADLEEAERLSSERVTFSANGRERTMTRYEFSQYQRQLETRIRKARVEAHALGAAGAGKADADRRVRAMLKGYRDVSEQAGIRPRMELTRISIPR